MTAINRQGKGCGYSIKDDDQQCCDCIQGMKHEGEQRQHGLFTLRLIQRKQG